MKQLVVVSTFYQCVSVAAAVDAGSIPAADERILVVADGALNPELTTPFRQHRQFDRLAARFDRVVDLSALMYPRRPAQFSPAAADRPLWQRALRQLWGLGEDPVELYVEALVNSPSVALTRIFHDALIHLHADGLMVYSPTRDPLPALVGQRVTSVVYPDLIPGLRPTMLTEWGPQLNRTPTDALRSVFTQLAEASSPAPEEARPGALVLGQYLAQLNLISPAEELSLHQSMLTAAQQRGARHIIFKPHPAASPMVTAELSGFAQRAGLTFEVETSGALAEVVMLRRRPTLVVSCFSTGLATAAGVLGIPALAIGTDWLLPRLAPFENSNRMPVLLADACFGPHGPTPDLPDLVAAVAYCMQPDQVPQLRERAQTFLGALVAAADPRLARYFKRRRLSALDLPGQLPPRQRTAARRWASRLAPAPARRVVRATLNQARIWRQDSVEQAEVRP